MSYGGAGETNFGPKVQVSTIYYSGTVQQQLAANSVYQYKTNYDAYYSTMGKNATYQFKSDWERMQYLQGRQGLLGSTRTITNRF
jgi:hypothetical protein